MDLNEEIARRRKVLYALHQLGSAIHADMVLEQAAIKELEEKIWEDQAARTPEADPKGKK